MQNMLEYARLKMARELFPFKKVIGLDRVTISAIEKWRRRQDALPSANAAIRALIQRGLSASKAAPPPRKV
jgi:hypothetical protein